MKRLGHIISDGILQFFIKSLLFLFNLYFLLTTVAQDNIVPKSNIFTIWYPNQRQPKPNKGKS